RRLPGAPALPDGRGALLGAGSELRALAGQWGSRVAVSQETGQETTKEAVLVRPDGYVAWAGHREQELAEALHHWFGPPA
ncbi:hypothetical protein AB0J52_14665, partial [Spirillospora sp. NPDC049652]